MKSSLRSVPAVARDAFRALRLRYTSLRRTVRNYETGLIACCVVVGVVVGLVTVGLRDLVYFLHRLDFALPGHAYLSAQTSLDLLRLAVVPAAGGLLLGLLTLALRKIRPNDIVDPVEANALYGGQMSLRDSMRLTGYTVVSNACGASVGMEAGYSQLGAGIFSVVGRYFHLRREDQRMMVTAGAAAAISAAFNAPLAGAFYGFELIHGSYTTRALAPVTAASLAGALVVRLLGTDQPLFEVAGRFVIPHWYYLLFGLLGIAAAGLGILTMKSATWIERLLRATRLPTWLRPAAGGVILSLIALGSPQVLGSGHGAIQWHLDTQWTFTALALLLMGKLVASAVSLGAGYRGGLFSSSLFLGALLGATFVQAIDLALPSLVDQRTVFMLVGMGSVGAAIIGAPFTMVFLVLEATGSFPVTLGMLVGVVLAATIVRLTFGYSFSTWRFHLRGLPLRGGHDIGWIAGLTAGRLMRSDAKTVPAGMTLAGLRQTVPLGSRKWAFAVDDTGRYVGMIDIAAAHDHDLDDVAANLIAADLATGRSSYMLPGDNIRTILQQFGDAQAETLPVLSSEAEPRILGYLTEAFCLKRYAQELERRRRDELGMAEL